MSKLFFTNRDRKDKSRQQSLPSTLKKSSLAGVRNRVLLNQMQSRLHQIATLISESTERYKQNTEVTRDLCEIAGRVTFVLGAINSILESERSCECETIDIGGEDVDDFLRNASLIAAIIESSLMQKEGGQWTPQE